MRGRRPGGRSRNITFVELRAGPAILRHWRPDDAVPFSSNPASARVLAKAGYRLEGTLRQSALKDGRVLDQWMYAILREERRPGK